MAASALKGEQSVRDAEALETTHRSKDYLQQQPQAMRAAAAPANAGVAGVYATSRTPKSLAALDNEATRKPVALREGSEGRQ
jgi:hypothetical protein